MMQAATNSPLLVLLPSFCLQKDVQSSYITFLPPLARISEAIKRNILGWAAEDFRLVQEVQNFVVQNLWTSILHVFDVKPLF